MKEILPDIFAIEVPEDAKNVAIKNGTYVKWITIDGNPFTPLNDLGKFRILFTTKDCSEEQAAQLPLGNADNGFGYKDYEGKSSGTFYADHSLQSLLRSHNLTGKNYLLIKRQP